VEREPAATLKPLIGNNLASCAIRLGIGVTITIPHRFDTPMTPPAVRRQSPPLENWIKILALCGLWGCGHSEPFTPRNFGTDQPFDLTPPIQITLNHGPDRRAAWLPDGSAIFYSTQPEGSEDHDVCLAVLPRTGGRQRQLICDLSPNAAELTEALESAAPGADGRLAYVAATGRVGLIAPELQELSLATVADPVTRTPVLRIPYAIPGRRTHGGVSQLRWLSPTRLLFLGEAVSVITPCNGCEKDTLRTGLDAVLLDISAAGALPEAIPGTDYASGVSPGGTADEIYYSIGGDSRVYHLNLATGAASVIHDFGAAGIVRDIHVVGNRMAAVVGGRVHFTVDPALGPTQWDSGGIVHLVNLQDGSDVTLDDPTNGGLFRRPQISPSGSQIVAERNPFVFLEITDENEAVVGIDTMVVRVGDLFLLGQS
jgi:hypothetical protein